MSGVKTHLAIHWKVPVEVLVLLVLIRRWVIELIRLECFSKKVDLFRRIELCKAVEMSFDFVLARAPLRKAKIAGPPRLWTLQARILITARQRLIVLHIMVQNLGELLPGFNSHLFFFFC